MGLLLRVVASLALVACAKGSKIDATSPPIVPEPVRASPAIGATALTASAEPQPAAQEQPEAPAVVERIVVQGDTPASIVRGPNGAAPAIVFLPGKCSNAYGYLLAFPEAARAHGGVIAIDGDKPCGAPGSGFHSFTWDARLQDARVRAALAAAGVTSPPKDGLTLVGYSAGAGIGEQMVQLFAERYPRVLLIGSPVDPRPERLAHARAAVTMSCAFDVPGRMKKAATRITQTGVPAMYLEMPGCTHGLIADGEHIFDEAFSWLAAQGS
jgi:pimeloyl-ACP methyl ester carboxylesterase